MRCSGKWAGGPSMLTATTIGIDVSQRHQQPLLRLLAEAARCRGGGCQAGLRHGVVPSLRQGPLCHLDRRRLGAGLPAAVRQEQRRQLACGGHSAMAAGGTPVSANWGGSTLALLKQSQHQAEAAKLATWLLHNRQSPPGSSRPSNIFSRPALPCCNDKCFLTRPIPSTATSRSMRFSPPPRRRWTAASSGAPSRTTCNRRWAIELGAAANGRGTLQQAFDRLQRKFVSYAQDQGFTVKT